jgi:enoyl-CoA hydratase
VTNVVVGVSASGVGTIELNRPDQRNALNVATCRELVGAVEELRKAEVRAIMVTGRGSAFCSGADFGEVYGEGFRDALYAALGAVHTAPVPVVAAVNGPAIGAGTQLAIACDIRVAAPGAVFGLPTARLGLAVDPWTIRRLEQVGGGGTARALLLACEQMGAELAHARGLADRIGERADAEALVADLATMAPLTLAYNKLVLDRVDLPEDDAELAAAFEGCWASEDIAEGRRARLEKRPPSFTGR